ncbi:hypothetical protein J3459_008449 [Metarhizium acridum]|uniref:uncharacterized protein n=1 Tax=Metarhizium acridum TaxID=92637 RepID=UPI001C6AD9AE|nr:hypothetical protein J3458_000264 [Metarhizium acridum]KAG8426047.1 hypothetical protein J3459_008449 [Metarhizium acridum]
MDRYIYGFSASTWPKLGLPFVGLVVLFLLRYSEWWFALFAEWWRSDDEVGLFLAKTSLIPRSGTMNKADCCFHTQLTSRQWQHSKCFLLKQRTGAVERRQTGGMGRFIWEPGQPSHRHLIALLVKVPSAHVHT